jgi:DNA primase
MDFYFASTFAKFNSQTLEGRREIKKVLLPVMKSIASKTEQSEWIKELARRLRADEKDLVIDLQKIKTAQVTDWHTKGNVADSVDIAKSRQEGLEERFLGLCLNNPQHFSDVAGIAQQDFKNEKLGQIFYELKKLIEQSETKDPFGHLQKSLSTELKMQAEYLSLKIQQQPSEETETFSEMENCVKELKLIKIRQKLTALSYEIEQTQKKGTKIQLKQLLEKFSQLSSELIQISKKDK